jgi:glycosyltransferase involved in cell wall biosynthesis
MRAPIQAGFTGMTCRPKPPTVSSCPRALLDARRNQVLGRCLRAADRVVCVSPALAGALRRLFWWNPPKTAFIPYGIDMAPYERAALPATGVLQIVCCGRLARSKGAEDMLEILALLQDRTTRLSAIGPVDPEYLTKLKARAAMLGVQDRVELCGPVPHGDIPERLAGADIYLFPSTHAEGLSKTVMEAMAAGLPVVAYDLPALRGLIETGTEGIVVPARRIDLAARAIDTILASPGRGRVMGRRGRERIERDYTTAQASQAWSDLLAEVVPDVQ